MAKNKRLEKCLFKLLYLILQLQKACLHLQPPNGSVSFQYFIIDYQLKFRDSLKLTMAGTQVRSKQDTSQIRLLPEQNVFLQSEPAGCRGRWCHYPPGAFSSLSTTSAAAAAPRTVCPPAVGVCAVVGRAQGRRCHCPLTRAQNCPSPCLLPSQQVSSGVGSL